MLLRWEGLYILRNLQHLLLVVFSQTIGVKRVAHPTWRSNNISLWQTWQSKVHPPANKVVSSMLRNHWALKLLLSISRELQHRLVLSISLILYPLKRVECFTWIAIEWPWRFKGQVRLYQAFLDSAIFNHWRKVESFTLILSLEYQWKKFRLIL